MNRGELERELKRLHCNPVQTRKAAETRRYMSRNEKKRLDQRKLERKYKSKNGGKTDYE